MTDAASSDHAADRPDTAPYPNSASVPAGAAERSAPGLRSVGRGRPPPRPGANEPRARVTRDP
ncbi:MAG: 3-methyl-2-oxobutanoate hydroxymethyltransferase, partial [Micrococcales bacterium]|nr:3-methyl-2-oxobutanoate hydroxymethyltransferase [Micrococcales bacterium]